MKDNNFLTFVIIYTITVLIFLTYDYFHPLQPKAIYYCPIEQGKPVDLTNTKNCLKIGE